MLKIKSTILKLLIPAVCCSGSLSSNAQETVNKHIVNSPDLSGVGLAFFGMLVVFLALALLFFFIKGLGFILNWEARKVSSVQSSTQQGREPEGLSGEVSAAIVMALFLYGNELHDQEDPIITMTKVSRTYSPWSSKIYGLRKSPR